MNTKYKISLYLLIIVSIITNTSCSIKKKENLGEVKKIELNNIKKFKDIYVDCGAIINIIHGNKYSISVEGYQKDINSLKAKVKNDILNLTINESNQLSQIHEMSFNWLDSNKLKIYITIPNLHNITINGNADVKIKKFINESNVNLNIDGNSCINIDYLTTKEIGIKINDNSNLDINNLTANKSFFYILGNSFIKTNFVNSGEVNIDITGNSEIILSGTTQQKPSFDANGNVNINDKTQRIKSNKLN